MKAWKSLETYVCVVCSMTIVHLCHTCMKWMIETQRPASIWTSPMSADLRFTFMKWPASVFLKMVLKSKDWNVTYMKTEINEKNSTQWRQQNYFCQKNLTSVQNSLFSFRPGMHKRLIYLSSSSSSIYLSIYISTYLPTYLVYLSVHSSIFLSETICIAVLGKWLPRTVVHYNCTSELILRQIIERYISIRIRVIKLTKITCTVPQELRVMVFENSVRRRKFKLNFVVEWLTLLLRFREVPGSNLGPEFGYLDPGFS